MAQFDPTLVPTQVDQMRGVHLLLAAALLARRIDALKRRPKDDRDRVGRHALRLDQNSGWVWIGSKLVGELAGYELQLLSILHDHADDVVSRAALIRQIYDEEYIPGDEFQDGRLNTLVGRLRDKIEPDRASPRYILTVRVKGYRLDTAGKPPPRSAEYPQ
jgi:two-component system response regulator RegX3